MVQCELAMCIVVLSGRRVRPAPTPVANVVAQAAGFSASQLPAAIPGSCAPAKFSKILPVRPQPRSSLRFAGTGGGIITRHASNMDSFSRPSFSMCRFAVCRVLLEGSCALELA